MRLKPGRPDLGRYADLFDVPAAAGAFGVTFLGVSSLLLGRRRLGGRTRGPRSREQRCGSARTCTTPSRVVPAF